MSEVSRLGGIDRDGSAIAVGVDVGGTKTALGLLDAATLTLLAKTVIPTGPERGGAAVLRDVEQHVRALDADARTRGRSVVGIGVVVPENVTLTGEINSSSVITGWNQLPVTSTLGAVAPTVIDSDVRAAALAEALLGAGRPYRDYAFLTVGTGLSYCAVRDGRPVRGAHGGALHMGTSVLARLENGTELRLEDLTSGSALVARYTARGGTATRAEEVLAAARVGDQTAQEVVDAAARALGIGVALLINMLDPEAVVTGGGLGSADTEYWTAARQWARHYAHGHAKDTPVVRGQLGADAGVIGAALTGLPAATDATTAAITTTTKRNRDEGLTRFRHMRKK
jgi:glucokinase